MFTVVIHRDPRAHPPLAALQRPLDPFGHADSVESWHDDHCLIVKATTENTPESIGAPGIVVDDRTGLVLVAWARLDGRSDLVAAIGTDAPPTGMNADDTQLLAAALRRWGSDCVEHLVGAFAFAAWNPATRSLLVARDQLGFRPVFWYADDQVTVVSTTAATMPVLDDLRLHIDEEWMAQCIIGASMSHDRTAWGNVHKLAPGHRLVADADRAPQIERYHDFADTAPAARQREEQWVEAYRPLLDAAHRDRLRTAQPLGCETTGGLDSSTCLALAAKHWGGDISDIHSFGFIGSELEPDFIYETSRAWGIVNDHIGLRSDFATWPEDRSVDIIGYPQEHPMGTSHVPFYLLARAHGIRTLLSGFGGDEVVTNSGYLLRTELATQRRYRELYRVLGGSSLLKPARFAQTVGAARAGSDRNRVQQAQIERWLHMPLRPEVVTRWDLERLHHARGSYTAGFSSLHDWALHERLGNPFVAARLESCTLIANAFGVEYRWPLLDARLIHQWFATPSIEKYGPGGMGRYLHRRAVDGVVPDKIVWKRSKDMGAPNPAVIEAAQEQSRTLQPAAQYHPRIEALIDRSKLTLGPNAHTAARPDVRTRTIQRSIGAITQLDAWLQRHDP